MNLSVHEWLLMVCIAPYIVQRWARAWAKLPGILSEWYENREKLRAARDSFRSLPPRR